jgi:hypothetical protein
MHEGSQEHISISSGRGSYEFRAARIGSILRAIPPASTALIAAGFAYFPSSAGGDCRKIPMQPSKNFDTLHRTRMG